MFTPSVATRVMAVLVLRLPTDFCLVLAGLLVGFSVHRRGYAIKKVWALVFALQQALYESSPPRELKPRSPSWGDLLTDSLRRLQKV